MARKGGSKEGFSHDPSLSMPSEQRTSESNKQKISRIHDTFPSATKDHIAKILQFYDDDENKALDAITRDGGREALSHLAESGNLKNKNNKSKKKKKKQKKDSALSATASFDADDSSSIHSSGNVDADTEKDFQRVENGNGFLPDTPDDLESISSTLNNHERLQEADVEPAILNVRSEASTPDEEIVESKGAEVFIEQCAYDKSNASPPRKQEPESTLCASPQSDNSSEKQEDHEQRREKNRQEYKHIPRQRTNSFRRSKTSSLSEDSSSQHNPQNLAAKRGIDRCKKDLNRQTISLHRINSQVDKNLEDSAKKIKSVFGELQKQLDNRKKEVELELEKCKADALNLIKSRQDLAVELKRRVDRSPSMTDAEWNELRSDIKLFVTERKYDDDLGKTIWFQWTDISESFKSFGEVQPVKNVYSHRSNAVMIGGDASQSNNPVPSPPSSLINEELGFNAEKSDVAAVSDAVEDDALATSKEEALNVNKNRPPEQRTYNRVFSHKRFNNNRFQGNQGYRGRGGGGGGYSRPYHRNYQNYGNRFENDFRPHHHQDRNENPSYSGNDNRNSYYRDNKNFNRGRGPHPNAKYHNQQYRYNRDNREPYRANVDNAASVPVAESSTKTPAPEAAPVKPTVVNGVEMN